MYRKLNKNHPDILCGKTCYDLPVKEVSKLSGKVVSAYSGPNGGLVNVNRRSKPFDLTDTDVDFIDEDYNESSDNLIENCSSDNFIEVNDEDNNTSNIRQNEIEFHKSATLPLGEEIAGITCWDRPQDDAYGIATTLYESHPNTKARAGLDNVSLNLDSNFGLFNKKRINYSIILILR